MVMYVKYFVPEDGDDQLHPNVLRLQASNGAAPTLAEIRKAFPVPGEYHFRFLTSLGNQVVWLDTVDLNAPVSSFEGSIFLKATRTSSPVPSSSSSLPAPPVRSSSSSSSAKAPISNTTTANGASSKSSSNISIKPLAKPVAAVSEGLLNFSEDFGDELPTTSGNSTPALAASIAPSSKGGASPLLDETNADLLGWDTSSTSAASVPLATSNTDFFGLETLAPMPSTSTGSMAKAAPVMRTQPASGMGNSNSMGGMNNLNSMNSMGMNSMGGGPRGPINQQQQQQQQQQQKRPPQQPLSRPASGGGLNNLDPFSGLGR